MLHGGSGGLAAAAEDLGEPSLSSVVVVVGSVGTPVKELFGIGSEVLRHCPVT